MYRSFLSILFVLAIATALSAQSSTATQSGSTAQSQDKSATLTGCLSGPNDEGAYMLKTGRHSVEVGGTDDLKAQVGHEVKLSGSWARSGSEIGEREENESAEHNHEAATGKEAGEKAEANEAGEHHGKSEAHERHFKVSSVAMVADTCTSTPKE
jgi:hypothetical protein